MWISWTDDKLAATARPLPGAGFGVCRLLNWPALNEHTAYFLIEEALAGLEFCHLLSRPASPGGRRCAVWLDLSPPLSLGEALPALLMVSCPLRWMRAQGFVLHHCEAPIDRRLGSICITPCHSCLVRP